MPVRKSAATPAVVDVAGPLHFWLDGDLVLFKMTTADKVVCGAIAATDFIESFGRAAGVAHEWSSHRYGGDGFRFQSNAREMGRSKASLPAAE